MVKGKDYMARLERAARWRLPRQEAEEIVADYRDIVADPELLQGLGRPRDVIRPLTQPRPYRIWLAVFAAMALCLLLPSHSGFGLFSWRLWRLCFESGGLHLGPVLALLGAVLALISFRKEAGKCSRPLPWGIPAVLAVLLAWIGLVFLFHWACITDLDHFIEMWGTMIPFIGPAGGPVPRSTYLTSLAMCYAPFLVSFPALYWLVKARIHDRRWAAAYILSLTAILVSLETLALLTNMDPTASLPLLQRETVLKCAGIAAMGLIGTGLALWGMPPRRERSAS